MKTLIMITKILIIIMINPGKGMEYTDKIEELGIYTQKIAKIAINPPVYEIIIPQNYSHINMFLLKIEEEILNFKKKWEPKITELSIRLYENKNETGINYRFHIDKNNEKISIYNKDNWTLNSVENLINEITENMEKVNKSIDIENWYKLSQTIEFEEKNKWATIEATMMEDTQSKEEYTEKKEKLREFSEGGAEKIFSWMLEAIEKRREKNEFIKDTNIEAENCQYDLIKKIKKVKKRMTIIEGFVKIPDRKRGLLNIIGETQRILIGTAMDKDVKNNRKEIKRLRSETEAYLNIADKLKSIIKLNTLNIGRIIDQQKLLTEFTENIAKNIEQLYTMERMKEKSYIKYVIIQSIKEMKTSLGEIISDIDDTIRILSSEMLEAREGKLNPMLISPVELTGIMNKEGKLRHRENNVEFPEIKNGKHLEQLYKAIKVDIEYENNNIIIKIEIPMIDASKVADLHRIDKIEIPITTKSTKRAKIDIKTKYIAKYKRGEIIYIDGKMIEKCKQVENHYFCEEEIIELASTKEAECIEGLINRNIKIEEIKCNIIFKENEQKLEIIKIMKELYIYSCKENTELETECLTNENGSIINDIKAGMKKTTHKLARMGLIKIPESCSVMTGKARIMRKIKETHVQNMTYELPIIRNETNRRILNNPIWENLIKSIKYDEEKLKQIREDLKINMEESEKITEEQILESKMELKKLENYIRAVKDRKHSEKEEDPKYIHTITNSIIVLITIIIIIIMVKYQSMLKGKLRRIVKSTRLNNLMAPQKPKRVLQTDETEMSLVQ